MFVDNHKARTSKPALSFLASIHTGARARTYREAELQASSGPACIMSPSEIPAHWKYNPPRAILALPQASVGTLSLLAVYAAAVVAALLMPPVGAIGLPEVAAPAGSAHQLMNEGLRPQGYAVEASALPLPPSAIYEKPVPAHPSGIAAGVANHVEDLVVASETGSSAEGHGTPLMDDAPLVLPGAMEFPEGGHSSVNPGGPLTLGMYTSASLQVSASELKQIDGWLAENGLTSRIAIAGTFMDFEFPNPEWNIPHDLEAAWKVGYVPFVNIAVGTTDLGPRSAADVANGVTDTAIRTWARLFAAWTDEGAKWAYIAPLQEMNGGWVTYGLDPESYQQAYLRIQQIFAEEGVPEESVEWVFAPNGWSEAGHEFERYYPGDENVDVVAFSAFNFGSCSCYAPTWDTYETAFQPYLERMHKLAPDKPIFVAQTATVAQGGDKDAWLLDTFSALDDFDGVDAVIYFNVAKPEAGGASCPIVDWRLFDPNSSQGHQGFLTAVERMENGKHVPSQDPSRGGGAGNNSDSGGSNGKDSGDSGKDKQPDNRGQGHEKHEPRDVANTDHQRDVPGQDGEAN